MGVPSYFRWLSNKYSKIVVDVVEEEWADYDGLKVQPDASKPNPNGVEYDNLYLDMNGIIHPCSHPENQVQPTSHDEIIQNIFNYIDRIFCIVRPRKLLFLAIDGVAPRAKMNQQRSRRFRAAKEALEKREQQAQVNKDLLESGRVSLTELREAEESEKNGWKFDSNSITPGTEFMDLIARSLSWYVCDKLNSNSAWRDIQVVLSDASSPGEGEHKIMDFIRRQRDQPTYDPNTKHVLYGLDADLIMLGLATHEPHFTLLREFVTFNRPSEMARCKEDETVKQVPFQFLRLNVLREYLASDLYITNLGFEWDLERVLDDYVFLCFFIGNDFLPHMPTLEIREGAIDLLIELYKKILPSLEGYITDSGEVNLKRAEILLKEVGELENAILAKRLSKERHMAKVKAERERRNGANKQPVVSCLSSAVNSQARSAGDSNHQTLPQSGQMEKVHGQEEVLRVDTEKVNKSNKMKAAQLRKSLEHESISKKMKLEGLDEHQNEKNGDGDLHGEVVEEKEGCEDVKLECATKQGQVLVIQTENESVECGDSGQEMKSIVDQDMYAMVKSAEIIDEYSKPEEGGLDNLDAECQASPKSDVGAVLQEQIDQSKQNSNMNGGGAEEVIAQVDQETDRVNVIPESDQVDDVRLGEEGWKSRYYLAKFKKTLDDKAFFDRIKKEYVKGLIWVLRYYYQGCCSWNWYYPYHYAPFACDLSDLDPIDANEFVLGEPFCPFEQLMSVLPAASKDCLPEVYHSKMTRRDSPIIDFYPESFKIDLNGKMQLWQGVALLDFIDEERLLKVIRPIAPLLSYEETRRNSEGYTSLMIRNTHPSSTFVMEFIGEGRKKAEEIEEKEPNIDAMKLQKCVANEMKRQLDPSISGSIFITLIPWLEAKGIGEKWEAPISGIGHDIVNNQVLSIYIQFPVYPETYCFKSGLRLNVVMPEAVLTPEELNQRKSRQFGANTPASRILDWTMRDRNGAGGHNRSNGPIQRRHQHDRNHPYANNRFGNHQSDSQFGGNRYDVGEDMRSSRGVGHNRSGGFERRNSSNQRGPVPYERKDDRKQPYYSSNNHYADRRSYEPSSRRMNGSGSGEHSSSYANRSGGGDAYRNAHQGGGGVHSRHAQPSYDYGSFGHDPYRNSAQFSNRDYHHQPYAYHHPHGQYTIPRPTNVPFVQPQTYPAPNYNEGNQSFNGGDGGAWKPNVGGNYLAPQMQPPYGYNVGQYNIVPNVPASSTPYNNAYQGNQVPPPAYASHQGGNFPQPAWSLLQLLEQQQRRSPLQ